MPYIKNTPTPAEDLLNHVQTVESRFFSGSTSEVPTVNLADVHACMTMKTTYNAWRKNVLQDLTEGVDYLLIGTDIHVNLATAIAITSASSIHKDDKKVLRQYFHRMNHSNFLNLTAFEAYMTANEELVRGYMIGQGKLFQALQAGIEQVNQQFSKELGYPLANEEFIEDIEKQAEQANADFVDEITNHANEANAVDPSLNQSDDKPYVPGTDVVPGVGITNIDTDIDTGIGIDNTVNTTVDNTGDNSAS